MNTTKINLQEELAKIDVLMKTPVSERPRYKQFYEQVKKMAEEEQETVYEPKWMRESYVWMANRPTLDLIRQQESEDFLMMARSETARIFRMIELENRTNDD